MRGTFTMCNVSPQDAAFNRGVWLRMEEWVRGLVNCDDSKEVTTNIDTHFSCNF